MASETLISRLQFAARGLASSLSYGISQFRDPIRSEMWKTVHKTRREIPPVTTPLECSEIFRWTKAIEKIPGDLAEVGAYKGGTAALSFVHLDMDLYEGTKAALQWFWPRLSIGGAILSHDYPSSQGVVEAFHEFFDHRPDMFASLSGGQCRCNQVEWLAPPDGLTDELQQPRSSTG